MQRIKDYLLFMLLRLHEIAGDILDYLTWPFRVIKALIEEHQLEKKYPDFMERYAERRRIQDEVEENERCCTINAIRRNIAVNLGVMEECMESYLDVTNPNRKPKKKDIPLDDLKQIFPVAQQAALIGIRDCEHLGASFANNFASQVESVSISSCNSMKEIRKLSDNLFAMLNNFEFGESPKE